MRELNSYQKDSLSAFFKEETGINPEYISVERSHRGKYFTNVRITIPQGLLKLTTRRELVLPLQDSMLDGINNGFFPINMLKMILGGALHKCGFYHPTQARPETDRYLY